MIQDQFIVISLKPKWVSLVLEQRKTIELRKSFAKELRNDTLALIYASSPISAIVGTVTIEKATEGEIDYIWNKYGEESQVSKQEFMRYFHKKNKAIALHLNNPVGVNKLTLGELRTCCNFVPPVSWRYLKDTETHSILPLLER
ncbi:hypothetical protein VIBNISOn1_230025 [Vibrio nigripulchritudo SOn1]|uniref:ASCH domain-containing protein n=1 Tax=Vibrio nigripulchritudo SOn1 TaxID=1238450 RepID=A0AAV2VQZ1_9VIBR|nr:hypothetical protein [Vibrio nigripulchritudo]CCO47126.1 hypothetical protein VIBNISOn1_230025 [Vibrio nigripulchritudo SOn1]